MSNRDQQSTVVTQPSAQAMAASSRGTVASTIERLQRSIGRSEVGFRRRGPKTVLDILYQSGCCKVRLPRKEPGREMEAVLINTAGGLTDGDCVTTDICWGAGTTASVTSQAAERIYRSRHEPARIATNIKVKDDATAFWLPQETILFDRGRFERDTKITLAPSARLLATESIVFGRAAMGETVTSGRVFDRWRVRLGGRLVFADQFLLDGPITEILARPAIAGGATAVATIIYVGSDAPSFLTPARDALATVSCRAGASCRDNVLICRIVARSGALMRNAIIAVADQVRLSLLLGPDAALPEMGLMPRVWYC